MRAKDTPGFIANRIGTYWLQTAIDRAIELGLTVEEADAVMGAPVGIPKTGVFGLLDLVGVDLIPKVAASMDRLLPACDRLRANRRDQPLIAPDDRGGRDRPEGQGRLLPSEPSEWRAGQGSHRPPHRGLSRRA